MLLNFDLETSLAAAFYLILSLWWFVSVNIKYASCIRGNVEFQNRVVYPCCGVLRRLPMEGVIKFVSAAFITAISAVKCYENCDENRKLAEVTIFAVFSISGLCDILTQKCHRYVFSSIDYFILIFAFLLQSVVSACHTDLTTSSLAVADDCMMYAAAGAALAVLLEFKFTDVLWFSLLRCFCTLLLGTWNFQIAVILNDERDNESPSKPKIYNSSVNKSDTIITNVTGSASQILLEAQDTEDEDHLLLVPMYFSWHCFADMVLLLVLWLIIYKLSNKQSCGRLCSCNEDENESHFEHHVHFDYHIIDRLDSDLE